MCGCTTNQRQASETVSRLIAVSAGNDVRLQGEAVRACLSSGGAAEVGVSGLDVDAGLQLQLDGLGLVAVLLGPLLVTPVPQARLR